MDADHANTQEAKLGLDYSVERQKGESWTHWAMKAAIVFWLRSHPDVTGAIETERKVEDLIADVRCEFNSAPAGIPQRCVFEAQTSHSNKDIVRATARYHRFGYSVLWLFDKDASGDRRDAERELSEYMSNTPSLGLISLEDGEIQLGQPIDPDTFESPFPKMAVNELYVPTHERKQPAFDHGDFGYCGEQLALVTVDNELFITHKVDSAGQRTLPQPAPWTKKELSTAIFDEQLERRGPVRGPP